VQEHVLDVSRTDAEIARLRAEQEQARTAAARLGHEMVVREQEIAELDRRVREEAELRRVRLTMLRGAQLVSESDELSVLAPCDGTVVRLGVRAAAAVVSEGAVLGELVCAGEELRAEVSVVDEGMGLVKHGQSVKLYYDAFPYQRHGVRYGVVSFIGPGSALKAEGPAFRVLADLGQSDFEARGASYPLLPGMTGRAEIIVAQQSALAYVFEPIRALGERVEHGP
jgi:multidrug efflux pump subunit AcrA (membrane-fusion protein)